MIRHVFSCHIFVMPGSCRRRYRSDRLLDHFIFLQELFQICAADFFEYLVQRDLFLEAQVHIGNLLAVAQRNGRVEQVADVVNASPDLRYAAVNIQKSVDRFHAGADRILGREDGVARCFGKLSEEREVDSPLRHDVRTVAVRRAA